MRKKLKGAHVELTTDAMAAWKYCTKEESRVEGPWTKGVPPAKLNRKGDKAARNKLLIEMGAAKAVDTGLVRVEEYLKLKANL